jgi:hypothetical protein
VQTDRLKAIPTDVRRAYSAVKKYMLTGAPVAGKTESIRILTQRLQAAGCHVEICPEAATAIRLSGDAPANAVEFQAMQLQYQFDTEDTAALAAVRFLYTNLTTPVVILCDRGKRDGQAWVDSTEWNDALSTFDPRPCMLNRYHLIFHLRSAAVDMPDVYRLAIQSGQNAARTSSEIEYLGIMD